MSEAQARLPSAALLAGRRTLDALSEVEPLEDLKWCPQLKRWELKLRLSLPYLPDGPVAKVTDWYLLISDNYPEGSIYPMPALEQGLEGIFPHQGIELELDAPKPYSRFAPCLRPVVASLGRSGMNPEPMDADWRLTWRLQRLRLWLELAARGELLAPGDAFELPYSQEAGQSVVVAEGANTFGTWQNTRSNYGLLDMLVAENLAPKMYVTAFRTPEGRIIQATPWGDSIRRLASRRLRSAWLKLPSMPLLPPWRYPSNWGDLRTACQAVNVNLDSLLRKALAPIRDGEEHIVLLGYPIPALVGAEPVEYRWHALSLPPFKPEVKLRRPRTFSTGMVRAWAVERQTCLASVNALKWHSTLNWHQDRLAVRGRLGQGLCEAGVLIIGAGAVGSHLAETLARGGVTRFTLVDNDLLEIGNLSRHTLTLTSLYHNKAEALAGRLRAISPFVKVNVVSVKFPPDSDAEVSMLRASRLVIDCTASDEAIRAMARFTWHEYTRFFSVSLGYAGRRLFLFQATGERFPQQAFDSVLDPWLRLEADERAKQPLPWLGAGCWHPYFPAREDDVLLMVATAVRGIDDSVTRGSYTTKLMVYAQNSNRAGQFEGVSRVALPDAFKAS